MPNKVKSFAMPFEMYSWLIFISLRQYLIKKSSVIRFSVIYSSYRVRNKLTEKKNTINFEDIADRILEMQRLKKSRGKKGFFFGFFLRGKF